MNKPPAEPRFEPLGTTSFPSGRPGDTTIDVDRMWTPQGIETSVKFPRGMGPQDVGYPPSGLPQDPVKPKRAG